MWEKSSRPNEFKVIIDDFMLTIACPPSIDPAIAFLCDKQHATLMLWNAKGERIDEVSAEPTTDDYNKLSELYNLARRQFLKIDEALNSIISKI